MIVQSVDRLQRAAPGEPVDIPQAMRHPQQQVYVAIAAAAGMIPDMHDLVERVAEHSGQRDGVLPVGALEPVDLDVVGLTALACRRFGRDEVLQSADRSQTFRTTIGLSQMIVATELDRRVDDQH